MLNYDHDQFIKDIKTMVNLVKNFDPEVILPVARGGLCFGHLLSEELNIRDVFCINSIGYDGEKKLKNIRVFNIPIIKNKKVLIVDDIADSGETLKEVLKVLKDKNPSCEFKTATLFYKKDSILKPDFTIHEAKEWINYFWNA